MNPTFLGVELSSLVDVVVLIAIIFVTYLARVLLAKWPLWEKKLSDLVVLLPVIVSIIFVAIFVDSEGVESMFLTSIIYAAVSMGTYDILARLLKTFAPAKPVSKIIAPEPPVTASKQGDEDGGEKED